MQVLPPNPLAGHLNASTPPGGGSLPPNPLAAHLAGTAAPVASQAVKQAKPSTDPLISMPTAPNVTPAPGQRSDQAQAQRAAITQTPHGGATGMLAEWTGPSLAHLLTTGHVDSATGLGIDALGLLPFGKITKGIRLGVDVARGARTAEEAGAHVAEAAATARAEGHGVLGSGGRGNAPLLKPGEVTAETGGAAGAKVRAALKGKPDTGMGPFEKVGAKLDDPSLGVSASQARTAQDALYHEARVQKVGALTAAHEGNSGLDAVAAGRAALKGELPKITWNGIKRTLDQSTLNEVINHALNHPGLLPLEKQTVMDALHNAWKSGVVPTQSEHALLDRVFGKEAQPLVDALKTSAHWKQFGVDLLNVPRAVMASTDLSAPLRQGLVYGVSHPVMFAKTFVPMMKAAVKEGYFQKMIQDEIHDRPTFPLMEKAGVAFTDIGKDAKHGAASLGAREEARMSNLAERIPVWGRVIRGSDRAYVGFLNKARADYFDKLVQDAATQGLNVNDEHLLQSIGKVINTATGRGNVPKVLQDHLATMNALFFSPRLLASRVNMLNPVYYARLDPFARREALRNLAALGGTALTVLELAKLGGAQVNGDPRNADFGKIRMGNTRLDILGGFQQPIRLGAQLYTGTIISSTTGKKIQLAGGFAHTSRYDVAMRFLQSKFSPVPSAIVDVLKGQTFGGQKITAQSEIVQRVTPLLAQDIWSLYHTPGSGGLKAVPEAGLGVLGVGVQSYAPKAPKGTGSSTTGNGEGFWGDSGSSGGGQGYWGP